MEKWRKEELTEKIINACINVHKELGPGFLESIYHNALKIELERLNLAFESEKKVKIKYLGVEVGVHRIDLLVEDEIVVELKTVEDLNKKYYAQVRSYLKAFNKEIGLLVNFADFAIDVRRVELDRKGPR
ncbi:MAG: GxxExxY protein [Candidatus Brocadia sp.]|nr:GxxExxY protein [Candidatus Brocadia sp.]